MSRIGIVTDSSGDLPVSFYSENKDIIMVPLYVRFGWEALMDWYDISPEFPEDKRRYTINGFYEEMSKCEAVPHTIPVNVCRLQSAYEELSKECDAIISLHFSHHLGYTVKAAEITASRIKKCKVIVIDTLQISNGYGAIIKELVKQRDKGLGVDELVKFVKEMMDSLNNKLIMTNRSSKYLYRCGRMNLFIYMLANIIGLKNFTIKDGKITPLFGYRGQNGLQKLLDEAVSNVKEAVAKGKRAYVVVSHANNDKEADLVIDRLKKEKIECEKRFLGPITGVYGGPGTYAIMPVILN
ncbi:MAG: DegV family protein [Bacillota bacterium]